MHKFQIFTFAACLALCSLGLAPASNAQTPAPPAQAALAQNSLEDNMRTGSELYKMGHYDAAEPYLQMAVQQALVMHGPNAAIYGTTLNNLAALLRVTDRHTEAETLYHEALTITASTLGKDHAEYGNRLNALAGLLKNKRRYAEAEPFMRETVRNAAAALGKDHADYGIRLNNLALLLFATRRHEEAVPLFRESVTVLESALGADHPHTQKVKANLQRLLESR